MDPMDQMDQMDGFTFYGNAEKSILSIWSIGSIKTERWLFCWNSLPSIASGDGGSQPLVQRSVV